MERGQPAPFLSSDTPVAADEGFLDLFVDEHSVEFWMAVAVAMHFTAAVGAQGLDVEGCREESASASRFEEAHIPRAFFAVGDAVEEGGGAVAGMRWA